MGFVLKIYFLGLIAFVPGQDGREMTVLMLDARQTYAVSDGTMIEPHTPLLVVRAGSCSGACRDDAQKVADTLFNAARVPDPAENLRQLQGAIAGGGAWILDGSDLTLELPGEEGRRSGPGLEIIRSPRQGLIPTSPEEIRDFGWVAGLGAIDAKAAKVDPDVVAPRPQKGLIAARLRLDQGRIGTYNLVTYGNKVMPVTFRMLRDERRPPDGHPEVVADWVVAEVRVSECSVRLAEKRFLGDGKARVLELAPERCDGTDEIELALLNTPAYTHEHSGKQEKVGKHFEMYYELAYLRPPNRLRPVPVVSEVPGETLPTRQEERSALLRALSLPRRGVVNPPICPTAFFEGVAAGQ
jgi:hypothetical protein